MECVDGYGYLCMYPNACVYGLYLYLWRHLETYKDALVQRWVTRDINGREKRSEVEGSTD